MMQCTRVTLPGGGSAIICGSAPRRKPCQFCKDRFRWDGITRGASLLCDFPIAKTLGGGEITCDAAMCDLCALEVGPDRHHCPKHKAFGGVPARNDPAGSPGAK
jgi:hypothetical protein